MLYLDSPIYFINDLQIHRDFQNHNQFYYFPAAPRLHRENGKPDFQLLKYARDVTDNPLMPPEAKAQVGGGFLVFTVDIGVEEETLEDAKRQLARYAEGQVMLAPVPFHTGTVRLVALGAEGQPNGETPAQPTNIFVEKIFGTTKPSLYGDNLALFGLSLSQEGATLLEDSFRHGGGLLGVVYDLTYAGIRPSLAVKAKVDFNRVYQHFDAKLGFQYACIGAELEASLEWLREQGAIEIQITQYDTDPATATEMRKEAMELIKQEVIGRMFKPSLQVPTANTQSTGNLLEQVVRLSRELRTPAPAGTQAAPPPPGRTTVGQPEEREMAGGRSQPTTAGNASTGGGRGTPGFALTLSLKYVRQEERKTAEFDFNISQAVNRSAAPQGSLRLLVEDLNLDDYIREVNLDDPFFRELGAQIGVTGNYATLGIDRVVVNATYQPDPSGPVIHTAGWEFPTSNEPSKSFNVLLDKNRPVRAYTYQTEVFLKDLPNVDSKTRVLRTKNISEQRQLLINPANEFNPVLVSVEAGPLDWTKVSQVDVALRYSDPDNQFEAQQLFSLNSDRKGPFSWIVYPANLDPLTQRRNYTVAYTYYLADGTSFQLQPLERAAEGIVVPPPFKGTLRVRLIPAVDWEEIREVTAEVLFETNGYRFHHESTFEAGDVKTRAVDIPVLDPDPDRDAYQARWSIVKKNFEVYEVGWAEYRTPQLVLDDGVHSVEEVQLELINSPEILGLNAVELTLESLTPDGQVVDRDTVILRGGDSKKDFTLLLNKGTPLRYRYQVKKYRGDIIEALEFVESSNSQLLLNII